MLRVDLAKENGMGGRGKGGLGQSASHVAHIELWLKINAEEQYIEGKHRLTCECKIAYKHWQMQRSSSEPESMHD